MDRMAPSEGADAGSIPAEGTAVTKGACNKWKAPSSVTLHTTHTGMTGIKTTTLIGIAVALLIAATFLVSLSANTERQRIASITNFDECAAAGYPIMESYPEQCAVPDGRTFVNERQTPPDGMTRNGCAVAGCSSQLCMSAEEAESGGVSTCEFRAEYACYRQALCEPQANGKCGWTETTELKKCLANPPTLDTELTPVF